MNFFADVCKNSEEHDLNTVEPVECKTRRSKVKSGSHRPTVYGQTDPWKISLDFQKQSRIFSWIMLRFRSLLSNMDTLYCGEILFIHSKGTGRSRDLWSKNANTPCHKTKGQMAGVAAVGGRAEGKTAWLLTSLLSYFTEVAPLKMFHKCEYNLSAVRNNWWLA